jgi:polyhydroxybutyrate depolymerase
MRDVHWSVLRLVLRVVSDVFSIRQTRAVPQSKRGRAASRRCPKLGKEVPQLSAAGLSNGGALSFLLACRAADVFAATAPVSIGNGTRTCEPVRPISVVMVRGTADDLVSYDGGATHPSAMADLTEWKALNACTGSPQKVNGVCDQYSECRAGAEVMLCTIPRGTHILYSDASKAGAPVADVAWDMFKRHALP